MIINDHYPIAICFFCCNSQIFNTNLTKMIEDLDQVCISFYFFVMLLQTPILLQVEKFIFSFQSYKITHFLPCQSFICNSIIYSLAV